MMELLLKSESATYLQDCPSSAARMRTFLDDSIMYFESECEDMQFLGSGEEASLDETEHPAAASQTAEKLTSGFESGVSASRGPSPSIPIHAARMYDLDVKVPDSAGRTRENSSRSGAGTARKTAEVPAINATRLTEKDVPSFQQWFSDLGDRPFQLPSTTVPSPSTTATPYSDAFVNTQHQRKSQRNQKEGHVKRPVNCFMLFSMMYRRKFLETHPNANNAGLSKLLSRVWKVSVPESEKDVWRAEYDTLMKYFKMENPTYKYRPKKKKITPGTSTGQQLRVKNQLGLTVDTRSSQQVPGPALITPPPVAGDASMNSGYRGSSRSSEVDFYLPLTPDEPSTPPGKAPRVVKRASRAAKVPKTVTTPKKSLSTRGTKRKKERVDKQRRPEDPVLQRQLVSNLLEVPPEQDQVSAEKKVTRDITSVVLEEKTTAAVLCLLAPHYERSSNGETMILPDPLITLNASSIAERDSCLPVPALIRPEQLLKTSLVPSLSPSQLLVASTFEADTLRAAQPVTRPQVVSRDDVMFLVNPPSSTADMTKQAPPALEEKRLLAGTTPTYTNYAVVDPSFLSDVPDRLTEEELRHNLPPWFTLSQANCVTASGDVGISPTLTSGHEVTRQKERVEQPSFSPAVNHVTDFEVEHPAERLPNDIFDDSATDNDMDVDFGVELSFRK